MSNNDVISREYLRDAFDNLCCHNCKTCRNFRIEDSFYKCALIDNAPTVDFVSPTINVNIPEETKQKLIEELQKPHTLLVLPESEVEVERPQGEWITKGYEPFGKCNICGGICEINNFCGHCGVKMKYNTEK